MHNVGLAAYLRELRRYVVQVGRTTSARRGVSLNGDNGISLCASIKLINRNPHESGAPLTVGLQEVLSLPARQQESGVLEVLHAEVASDQNTPKVE